MKRTFFFLSLLLASCLKGPYDLPPDNNGTDPGLPVNMTVAALRAKNPLYYPAGNGDDTMRIGGDWTLGVVVIANDQSGNLYKQLMVEDSTGGIALNLDAYSLYASYPVGRKIYIKLQGLMLSFSDGVPVLSMDVDERKSPVSIGSTKIAEHLIKATLGHAVRDTVVEFDDVRTYTSIPEKEALLCRLVTIRGVQFADTARTYTTPTGTTNRYLLACGEASATSTFAPNGSLAIRTSNYSSFHASALPAGRGTIKGIYTVYIGSATTKTPQLLLRDTGDVQFTEARCGKTAPPLTGVTMLSQGFDSAQVGEIQLPGWTNASTAGGKLWEYSTIGSGENSYARMSTYGSNDTSAATWLITPELDFAGAVNPKITFKTANGFDNGATLKLYVSTNYTGDIAAATWIAVSFTRDASSPNGYSGGFTSSGNVKLNAFIGYKVHIGWKYDGADKPGTNLDRTTTWELDDIRVSKD